MMQTTFKHWLSFICYGSWKIDNLAADIARRCKASLIHRIINRSNSLPPEQMRGYVQAYATGCLESVVREWVAVERPDPALISEVVLRAKEFLIEIVLSEMQVIIPPVVADITRAA